MKKRSIKDRRKKDYGPDWPNGKDKRKKEKVIRRNNDKPGKPPYDSYAETSPRG